jgi:hypothetical protein
MTPGLLRMVGAGVFATAAVIVTAPLSTWAQDTCRQGFVWREAFPGDHVCVSPGTRSQASQDNSQAGARRQPGGGPYGPNTCVQGYVWREARPNDLVCVTPETRAQAASDNAQASARRAAAAPPAAPAPAPASGYKLSEWSPWARAEGAKYRYRWGWNPQEPRYADKVDAIFQITSTQTRVWDGAVRSLDCAQGTLSMSKRVVLQPGQTQEVKFLTPNCGTKTRPSFQPNVVRSVRID